MTTSDVPLILVTGATGAVGPAIVRATAAAGYRIRTLTRSQPPPGLLPPGVDLHLGDIRDDSVAVRALHGADVVLHLAALLHLTTPAGRFAADYADTNTAATANLAARAAASGARRFVFFSTIAVYGEDQPGLLTEEADPNPGSEYARSKLRGEAAVLQQVRPDGAPLGVILRPAAVYGPRLRGNYRTMLRFLASRKPMLMLPGRNRRTLVFDEDLAAAALQAAFHPDAAGRTFNVSDGATPALSEIVVSMCRALRRQPPSFGVPAEAVRAFSSRLGPLATRGPLGRVHAMVEKYSQQIAVDGSLIQRALGFRPGVTLDEGW